MSIVEMSSRKNAPVPETMYKTRPATAMLLVFATLHKSGETKIGDNDEKCRKADNELDKEIRFACEMRLHRPKCRCHRRPGHNRQKTD